jgi:hypothetical protein
MKKTAQQMKLIFEEMRNLTNEVLAKEPVNETWIDGVAVQSALHISEKTLYRHRKSGILSYSRIRGKIYYKKADIKALLEKNYRIDKPKCKCPLN